VNPQRLDIRHLRNHALEAMRERRLSVAPETCLLGIARDDEGAVVIHVNSGGNTCAVETRLNLAGYRAEALPFDPDVYGGKVRVTLRARRSELGRS
jgi:hypothetical protein